MRAIILLGLNYARTQWIAVAVMVVYLAGIGAVFRPHVHRADVLFFLRWHAGYAVFLGTVLSVPALQMERKTRRILAVLSKGIYRWQYLGGLLCGCAMIAALFCGLVGGIAAGLCRHGGIPNHGLVPITLALFCCSVAAAATGLFFSTFLHPLLAAAATSITLALPIVAETMGYAPVWELFPVAWTFRFLLDFQLLPPGREVWEVTAASICQAAVFWCGAALVFARRDVTIAPE